MGRTQLSPEDIAQLEAKALLDSLQNSERLLPFTQSKSSQNQQSDSRDW